MNRSSSQLLGISNAIVDVLTHVEPNFIDELGAEPGSMTLIDRDRAEALIRHMHDTTRQAGGSVANSVACFASLGGDAAYIGRVADDALGNAFAEDMAELGVALRLAPETRHAPTARCHVFITPNGERTMQTYLGACVEIAVTDIREDTIDGAGIVLLEGYVWDTPEGPEAMREAIRIASSNGGRIALSLSDSFCVERHLETFRDVIERHADIVIGNTAECLALFGCDDFEDATRQARATGRLFVMTRSELGSVIIDGEQRIDQPADAVDHVEDATGAGDAYVAGFLYGLCQGWAHADSARLATRCATLALSQVGARPDPDALAALLRDGASSRPDARSS